jgi:hypothetical protein
MNPGSNLPQPTPSRRGRRRRYSNISISQINGNTYQENRCIRRARMNAASNQNTLGGTHEPTAALTHEQSPSGVPSDGTIVILVLSLCYG